MEAASLSRGWRVRAPIIRARPEPFPESPMRASSAVTYAAALLLVLGVHACDCGGGNGPTDGGDTEDGGEDNLNPTFTISTIDSTTPAEHKPIAMAVLGN